MSEYFLGNEALLLSDDDDDDDDNDDVDWTLDKADDSGMKEKWRFQNKTDVRKVTGKERGRRVARRIQLEGMLPSSRTAKKGTTNLPTRISDQLRKISLFLTYLWG